MAKGFFDVDDIMNNFFPEFFKWLETECGKVIEYRDIVNYKVADILKISNEEASALVESFCASDRFLQMKPDPKAVICIYSLYYSDDELYVLTSRHNDIRDHTREWVPIHFADVFIDIIFSANLYNPKADGKHKHETLAEFDADYYVEDNLDLALTASPHCKYVFLVNKPWNQCDNLPKNVIRVPDMLAISSLVRSLIRT